MRCANCHNENLGDAAFCAECGAKLELVCPSCALANAPGSGFCRRCGVPLKGPASAAASESPPITAREITGERRHLTVVFCDLAGSTAIAAQLDPEEWRETVAGYHRATAQAIVRFDGHVAKFLGDGVMAYFRWP